MLRKEITGYAAFDKESGKGLVIYPGFTNRLALTDDPLKVELSSDIHSIEMIIGWFNNSHKNQKEFEIKKVRRVIEIQEDN
jgi:hypothetical protein